MTSYLLLAAGALLVGYLVPSPFQGQIKSAVNSVTGSLGVGSSRGSEVAEIRALCKSMPADRILDICETDLSVAEIRERRQQRTVDALLNEVPAAPVKPVPPAAPGA